MIAPSPVTDTPPAIVVPKTQLYEVRRTVDGKPYTHLTLHHGQGRAWNSKARFVWVLAGAQSGKTSYGPLWLAKEIYQTANPDGGDNDYIAVTATFDLFKLKMLPVLLEYFVDVLGIGKYWSGNRVIELCDPRTGKFWARNADDRMWGRIILRSASSGGGLESITARGAWLDECGQPEFSVETWEAVLRRLSLKQGRVLGTSTLYDIGWLKTQVWDKFQRIGTPSEQPDDRLHEVINFDSTENPAFPREEYRRARRSMPKWRFDMFYRGLFTRPAGQIYDCFKNFDHDEKDSTGARGHILRKADVEKRGGIPDHWHKVAGIDFGVVHTCISFYAVEEDEDGYPTGRLWLYDTYFAGASNASGHIRAIHAIEKRLALVTGGAPSENSWRKAYTDEGVPIYQPTVSEVEVGIDRVYGAIKQDRLLVFDTLAMMREQLTQYSRVLDAVGEPTEKIKNKETYHAADTARYACLLYFPLRPFVGWSNRRNLLVKRDGVEPYPAYWRRFGGLRYRDGEVAAFVLCAKDLYGGVVVEGEVIASGDKPSEFAAKICALLESKGYKRRVRQAEMRGQLGYYVSATGEDIRIGCEGNAFTDSATFGVLRGAAIKDIFLNAGLYVIEVGGDSVNEWATTKEAVGCSIVPPAGAGFAPDFTYAGLRVQRTNCPYTSLTLPLLVSAESNPDTPDMRGPVSAGCAVTYALMTRPANATRPTQTPGSGLPWPLQSAPSAPKRVE